MIWDFTLMDLDHIKHIHFVGIKGVGMTGLAIIAVEMGKQVTGSDTEEEFVTQKALDQEKIRVWTKFDPRHIEDISKKNNLNPQNILVVTTGAHEGFANPEVKAAKQGGLTVMSHGQTLGFFMQEKIGIAVAGTHGKTTTTAMIAHILTRARMDPSYAAGTGWINSLGLPAHWGEGRYFVAEADEYVTDPISDLTPRFLWQTPKILVLTNIEYDHPDVFPDISSLQDAFLKFARNVRPEGVIIAGLDSPLLEQIFTKIDCRVITYGFSPRADYRVTGYKSDTSGAVFKISHANKIICEVKLGVFGQQNAVNGLAAILAAIEAGLSWPHVCGAALDFKGTGRRFELIGKIGESTLYDDYAHHPTEIKATLKMTREVHPTKHIICVFQPHTFSRTKALYNEFASAFAKADKVILTDIFASAREHEDPAVNSKRLAEDIRRSHPDVVYCPSLDDVVEYLRPKLGKKQIIITMGAGDVYKINEKL